MASTTREREREIGVSASVRSGLTGRKMAFPILACVQEMCRTLLNDTARSSLVSFDFQILYMDSISNWKLAVYMHDSFQRIFWLEIMGVYLIRVFNDLLHLDVS